MSEAMAPLATAREPVLHRFEFRGSGSEFFRIWIVNLALTLVTLGIYSAWAKVRTRRYFYGNSFVAGHSFDYHASPVRILIGRAIALALFAGYNISGHISPFLTLPWIVFFGFAIPWLIVSSQRFNARNTSYRNVRFNFTGTYGGAFKALILWPLAGVFSVGTLMPLAHRARDYYYVNNHTFGGKHFETAFAGKSIYRIYGLALLLFIGMLLMIGGILFGLAFAGAAIFGAKGVAAAQAGITPRQIGVIVAIPVGILIMAAYTALITYIYAKVYNLAASHTVLDGRHRLESNLQPWQLLWIGLSNLFLILITIGMFYPWARVRIAAYMADHMGLLAASSLDEFTSEVFTTKSAVGEEIAGFFDFDIGL